MKKLLSSLLLIAFLFVPPAQGVTKKIPVKPMQLLTSVGTPDEVSGVVTSKSSIIVYGSKADKAFVRAVDVTGKELWNLSLDQSPASIATAATVDSVGDIWIAGATPIPAGTTPPAPTTTALNPDNAVIPPSTFIEDLRAISIWKVSAAGALLFTNTLPTSFVLFPTSMALDKNGASIVGILATEKGSAGFLTNIDTAGAFSKLLQVGTASTTADAIVRHSDGSFTLAGSSAETIGGKKVVGVTDGILVKISKSLKITSVVRSSIAKGQRIWNSASTSLLLGGEVLSGSKSEVAVTKFSTAFVPTWTYRFPSSGAVLTLGSKQLFFLSTGVITQLNWSPKVATPLLLTFDSKGAIIAADSGPVGQKEVLSLLNSKELGLLAVSSSAESVSIFTLIPR